MTGRGRLELLLAFLLGSAAPLLYAAHTQHVWEDYFITFRHSRNLAEGNGLVYHVGERVHGFTSPVGTLLPAVFHYACGNPEDFRPALWLFRGAGALALGGAAALLLSLVRHLAPDKPLLRWAAVLLAAGDAKTVVFSANGQETAFVLLPLLGLLRLWVDGWHRRAGWTAACLAGLQYARPDGVVLGAAVLLAGWLAGPHPRGLVLRGVVRAGAVAVLTYLPWLGGTWWYYGSPLPHTVVAKAGLTPLPGGPGRPLLNWLPRNVFERAGMVAEPVYVALGTGHGDWSLTWGHVLPGLPARVGHTPLPVAVAPTAWWLGATTLVIWLLPLTGSPARLGRLSSLAFLLVCVYLSYVTTYPWYLPPLAWLLALAHVALVASLWDGGRRLGLWAFAAAVVVVGGARALQRHAEFFTRPADLPLPDAAPWATAGALLAVVALAAVARGWWRGRLAAVHAAGLVLYVGLLTAMTTRQMAAQQRLVEDGLRRPLAEWLRGEVRPGQTVYLECLGYLGYFSGARMLDFPGLVAPPVVTARRRLKTTFMADLIPVLRPDWLVLRVHEYRGALRRLGDHLPANYEVVREASVWRDVPDDLPGRGYLLFDGWFVVLRRTGAGG